MTECDTHRSLEHDKRYRFDTFMPYAGVSEAYEFCSSFASGFPSQPSLCLYGRNGLGKTHLQTATALQVLQLSPKTKVTMLCVEELAATIIYPTKSSISIQQIAEETDLLMVERLDWLAAKRGLQDTIASLFEEIDFRGGRILTDAEEPATSGLYTPRFVNFLARCRMISMTSPMFSERTLLASHLAKRHGVQITEPILRYIAMICWRNVSEIESAIYRVDALLKLCQPVEWPNSVYEAEAFLGYPPSVDFDYQ